MIASPSAVPSSVLKPFIAAITPAMTSATSRISATYSTVPCAVWIASRRAPLRSRSRGPEVVACIVLLRCFEWTSRWSANSCYGSRRARYKFVPAV
jgi:hypothetical protein